MHPPEPSADAHPPARSPVDPAALSTADFDYELPPELVAQRPAARRDESRLLVLDRTRGVLEHRLFRDLVEYLAAGDVLVLNETRVFPARLYGTCRGRKVEALLVRPEGDEALPVWLAMLRPGRKLHPGDRIGTGGEIALEVLGGEAPGEGLRRVRVHGAPAVIEALERQGQMPLPPYIRRAADEDDRAR